MIGGYFWDILEVVQRSRMFQIYYLSHAPYNRVCVRLVSGARGAIVRTLVLPWLRHVSLVNPDPTHIVAFAPMQDICIPVTCPLWPR